MDNERNNISSSGSTSEASQGNIVLTNKVEPMSKQKYYALNFLDACKKVVLWVLDLLWSVVLSLWHFVTMIGKGFYQATIGTYNFFKKKYRQFKFNDWSGRLSFLVFGASSFKNKQYVNGVLFLAFEIGYILFMILGGGHNLYMLGSLGIVESHEDPNCTDMFCDFINGDNSIMILIYGLLTLLSIFVFLYIWNRSINSGFDNFRIHHYMGFKKIYEENEELSKVIDDKAKEAVYSGVSYFAFRNENKEKYLSFAEKLTGYDTPEIEKIHKDMCKIICHESITHSYFAYVKIKNNEEKLAALQTKLEEIKTNRENKRNSLDLSDTKSVDYFDHSTQSIVARQNLKIKKQRNRLFEISKKHSNYSSKEGVLNASKYEKFNDFYKVRQNLRNQIQFYENYADICNKFDSLKDDYQSVNENNLKKKEELLVERDQKLAAINDKFDKIVERKSKLLAELKELNTAKQAEIKASGKDPLKINEIEDKYFTRISKLSGELHGLPEDKAIKAMRREELKEVKHACARDRKYLKTNFTSESYSMEEAVNYLLLEYKFDHNFAVKAMKEVVVKEKDKTVRHLTSEEVNAKIAELKDELHEYEANHTDCFVGRPKSFKEQLNSLKNENFHVTILSLPVLGIVLFTITPLLFSILIAFTNYSLGHQPPTQLFTWYGFENFITLFAAPADSVYAALPSVLMSTLGWTIIWTIFATFSNYFLGIILALLVNKKGIRFKKLWRTIFIMTIAVPQFISLMAIGVLLKDSGAIGSWWNDTFGFTLGFGSDPANGALVSKIIIIIVNIWIGIPYTMLSTTGILLNIPNDLYESATVDGAGTVTQFTKITLPYIFFVTGPYLITSFVGNVNNFNVIFFLTGGGPNVVGSALQVGHTDLLITFLYKMITSANNPQFGIASAVGIVIFVICAFFSIIMYNKSGAVQSEDQFQ